MSLRELQALAPGGVGGRSSPSIHEDQAATNAWRGIGVTQGHLEGSPRAATATTTSATPQPPARAAAAAAPPPEVKEAAAAATGNRVMDMGLLDEFLAQSCACSECSQASVSKVVRKVVAEFAQALARKVDGTAKNIITDYADHFRKSAHILKYVQAAISESQASSCVRIAGEQRVGLSSSFTVKCAAGHAAELSTSRRVNPDKSDLRRGYEEVNVRMTAGLWGVSEET